MGIAVHWVTCHHYPATVPATALVVVACTILAALPITVEAPSMILVAAHIRLVPIIRPVTVAQRQAMTATTVADLNIARLTRIQVATPDPHVKRGLLMKTTLQPSQQLRELSTQM